MQRTIICLLLILSLSACATSGMDKIVPIVDTHSLAYISQAHYEQDLTECQAYAEQTMSASAGAAAGAFFGALLGIAIGAAVGDNHAGENAAFGALAGAGTGASKGYNDRHTIVSRCLSGRGYNVLN